MEGGILSDTVSAKSLIGELQRKRTISPRAGKLAPKEMLADVVPLERECLERRPDGQRIVDKALLQCSLLAERKTEYVRSNSAFAWFSASRLVLALDGGHAEHTGFPATDLTASSNRLRVSQILPTAKMVKAAG